MPPQLLGNLQKGLFFIVSAPAGTGKTTLIKRLAQEFPCIIQSISYTTRLPRESEKNGVDYFFISKQEFEQKVDEHAFLEYVELYGDYYGTSKEWLFQHQKQGKHVVLVIDTQGALQLMGKLDATYIFISPPSKDALIERLKNRESETEETLQRRLEIVEKEMKSSCFYDYQVVNDQFETAYQILKSIFIAEENRVGNTK